MITESNLSAYKVQRRTSRRAMRSFRPLELDEPRVTRGEALAICVSALLLAAGVIAVCWS